MIPTVVPEVAYGLLWLWLLNPLYGPVNGLLTVGGEGGATVFGRLPPQWLTDPNDARAAIILMSLFTVGEAFVLLLVARQAVSTDLYELAALEDATGWDVFRRITLPLLAPVLVLLFLRDMLLSFTFTFVPALDRHGGRAAELRRRPTCRSSSTARPSSTCATATPRRRR